MFRSTLFPCAVKSVANMSALDGLPGLVPTVSAAGPRAAGGGAVVVVIVVNARFPTVMESWLPSWLPTKRGGCEDASPQ